MAGAPLRIGWKEYVDFPEWNLRHVKAKIDTGARTSVLDVLSYELIETIAGGAAARVRLALSRRHPERITQLDMPILGMIEVANSGGEREARPLVETTIRLGPVRWRIRLTLTNRTGMLFRMLLGRQALLGRFVVDPSAKYLLRGTRG